MAVEITGTYQGQLTCRSQHGPSGSVIETTAPADNGGTGTLFSPTDLLATATVTCMVTILGQWAAARGLDISGTRYRVAKHMATEPRRIGRLDLEFWIPGVPEDKRASMEAAMMRCPVKASLGKDVECATQFHHV